MIHPGIEWWGIPLQCSDFQSLLQELTQAEKEDRVIGKPKPALPQDVALLRGLWSICCESFGSFYLKF